MFAQKCITNVKAFFLNLIANCKALWLNFEEQWLMRKIQDHFGQAAEYSAEYSWGDASYHYGQARNYEKRLNKIRTQLNIIS